MTILIIGAGMAGLIAGNMLRRHEVKIWEKGPTLPHNHSAVLRFRTTAASDATGIPFTEERVLKGIYKHGEVFNTATLSDLNRYSLIVTGGNLFHRSIMDLSPGTRWCAPRDFIEQMAKNLNITYNTSCGFKFIQERGPIGPVISTVPMPYMMDMFGWRDKPEFRWLAVWTIKVIFDTPTIRVCQTLYQTAMNSWYRATLHGQELTLEFMFEPGEEEVTACIIGAMRAFGFDCECATSMDGMESYSIMSDNKFTFTSHTFNTIPIGKIMPIDEGTRKRFILWLTEKHGIYSLGRFATWRNILLDSVVEDVKKIEQLIEKGHTYDER